MKNKSKRTRPGVTDAMMLAHLHSTWDTCSVHREIVRTEPFQSGLANGTITKRMISYALQRLRRQGYIKSRGYGQGVVYKITPQGEQYLIALQAA